MQPRDSHQAARLAPAATVRLRRLSATRTLTCFGLLSIAILAGPGQLTAQFQDAKLPPKGVLWFDLTASLDNWDQQFAKDSPGTADGEREPLFGDFDGAIVNRLFPGAAPLIEDFNTDAAALGFDPVGPEDFSMGALDFGTINAQKRRLEVGLEFGLLDRLSLEARLPLALSDVEPFFAFDSASASVLGAASGVPSDYFGQFRGAVTALDALIAGGTLSPADIAIATGLRDGAFSFVDALERRATERLLIPTGLSPAGMQMAMHLESLISGFDGFGVTLPPLALPEVATSADMAAFFTDLPLGGTVPGVSRRGLAPIEFEVGARFGIIDQISGPVREAPPDTRPAAVQPLDPADPEEGGDPAAQGVDPVPEASEEPVREVAGSPLFRLRTSVGARVRLPIGSPSGPPFEDATDFMGIAAGDGQMDLEFALYQDVALGGRFMLAASARYGLQLADQVTLRIRPPDRPFAFEATQALVERDLGDYLLVRLAPRYRLSGALSIGFEYEMWHKQSDRYVFGPLVPFVEDASALEIESEQRRNRMGFTLMYEPGLARKRPDPRAVSTDAASDAERLEAERREEARGRRDGWRFAFTVRPAVSGSGGQTPAALLVAATMRIPMRFF
jgi:hypothetical protein